MDQELSKIESYSKAFAEKVCNSFFSSSEAITGDQILTLTPVDQVNLFVIKNLFIRWKDEVQKVKSPYFDYSSPGVKDALTTFLNTVSRHILIKKEFFKPLLEKAVYDSFILTIKPSLYFRNEFAEKNKVSADEVGDMKKYFRIHRPFWDALASRVQKETTSEEIIRAFDNYLIHTSSGDQRNYLEKFHKVLPFEIAQEPIQESSKVEPEESIEEKKPVIAEPVVKAENTVREKEVSIENIKAESSAPVTLNQKYSATQLTLNDVIKNTQAQTKTLADKISKGKVGEIRTAISLNQKFRFMHSLFNGIVSEYENGLNEIDKSADYEQALSVLSKNYADKYKWDFNNPEVNEFIEIIKRKFSN